MRRSSRRLSRFRSSRQTRGGRSPGSWARSRAETKSGSSTSRTDGRSSPAPGRSSTPRAHTPDSPEGDALQVSRLPTATRRRSSRASSARNSEAGRSGATVALPFRGRSDLGCSSRDRAVGSRPGPAEKDVQGVGVGSSHPSIRPACERKWGALASGGAGHRHGPSGGMFWLRRRTFLGSYRRLRACSRSKASSPNAARMRSSGSSACM